MRTAFVFLSVLLTALGQPQKPVWPDEFDSPFGLNVPPVPGVVPNGIINGSAHFYYSWTDLQASLIVYEDGCLPGIFTDSQNTPCNITFVPTGTFFQSPEYTPACLWFPGVGSVPPNFLEAFNYSGFQQIVVDMNSLAHYVYFWFGPSGFQYWTEISTGFDIAFVDGGTLQWAFGPLNAAPQNASLFTVPTEYKRCPFPVSSNFIDPLVKLSMALSNAPVKL